MTIVRATQALVVAMLATSTTSSVADAPQPDCTRKVSIKNLGCRAVERESSIRIVAVDQCGKPAAGLWVDATTKAVGREQSLQVDDAGLGKLWVARDRAYDLEVYGQPYDGPASLRDVRVSLGCGLQIRIVVYRNASPRDIIY